MSDSSYKLRKRIKELEEKAESYRKERNVFKEKLMMIYDQALQCENSRINPFWILSIFKDVIFKTKHY